MKLLYTISFLCISIWVQAQLLPVRENLKWGAINEKGKIVLPIEYDAVEVFKGSEWIKVLIQNQMGLVHTNGQRVFLPNITDIHAFNDSSIAVKNQNGWGLFDLKNGRPLICEWDAISSTPYGHFVLAKNGNKGLATSEGKLVCDTIYQFIEAFRKNFYKAYKDDTLVILDRFGKTKFSALKNQVSFKNWPVLVEDIKGKKRISHVHSSYQSTLEWTDFTLCADDWLLLSNSRKGLMVNLLTQQECVLPGPIKLEKVTSNFFMLESKGFYGAVSNKPLVVAPFEYRNLLFTGRLVVTVDTMEKAGAFNINGRRVLSQSYTKIEQDDNGAIYTQRGFLKGLCSPTGKTILEPGRFTKISVSDGLVKAKSSFGALMIELDKNWNEIDRFRFKSVKTVFLSTYSGTLDDVPMSPSVANNSGWYTITNGNSGRLWGYRDTSGRTKIQPRFQSVDFRDNGRALLTRQIEDLTKEVYILDGDYIPKLRFGLALTETGSMLAPDRYWKLDMSAVNDSTNRFITGLKVNGKFEIIVPGQAAPKQELTFVDSLSNGMARVNKGGYVAISTQRNYAFNVKSQYELKEQFGLPMGKGQDEEFLKKRFIKVQMGKWGFVDSMGHQSIPFDFDFAENFQNGLAIVRVEENWGVIDKNGEFVIQPEFSRIERIISNGQHYFKTFDQKPRYGYVDTNGLVALKPEFRQVMAHKDGVMSVKQSGRWQHISFGGNALYAENFESIQPFQHGIFPVRKNNGWAILDRDGNALPGLYDKVEAIGRNVVWAKSNGYLKLLDSLGNVLSQKKYTEVQLTQSNTSIVKLKGKYGYLSPRGKFILKPQFDKLQPFNEDGYAIAVKDGRFGLIDLEGNVVLPFEYEKMGEWNNNGAFAFKDREHVVVTIGGSINAIEHEVRETTSFSEGLGKVKIDGKWGFVDTTGSLKILARYDEASHFHEGKALVLYNGRQYFINRSGELSYRFKGTLVHHYSQEMAVVKRSSGVFFIDHSGKTLFDKKFQAAFPFNPQGLAKVKMSGKWGLINTKGQFVVEPRYADIGDFAYGLAYIKIRGSYGLYDQKGQRIIEQEGDDLLQYQDNIVRTNVYNDIQYFSLADMNWIWKPKTQ